MEISAALWAVRLGKYFTFYVLRFYVLLIKLENYTIDAVSFATVLFGICASDSN